MDGRAPLEPGKIGGPGGPPLWGTGAGGKQESPGPDARGSSLQT
jgi:hypothetical protein